MPDITSRIFVLLGLIFLDGFCATNLSAQVWEVVTSGADRDAIACTSERECYALGDPIGGKFVILHTQDGARWEPLPTEFMPPVLPHEGAFAAGNSCLAVDHNGGIYFVTGGPAARVFHSPDAGRTWKAIEIPLAKGTESSGAFSIAVDGERIVVVGGNYRAPERPHGAAAYSKDAGATWHAAEGSPGGFRSGVAIFDRELPVAVNTNGSDVSTDSGAHWKHTDQIALNALTSDSVYGMWGAGPKGTVARFHKRAEHNPRERRAKQNSPWRRPKRVMYDEIAAPFKENA
jgi:photosystem II stability/assembly factor-like uncharacterized protein